MVFPFWVTCLLDYNFLQEFCKNEVNYILLKTQPEAKTTGKAKGEK